MKNKYKALAITTAMILTLGVNSMVTNASPLSEEFELAEEMIEEEAEETVIEEEAEEIVVEEVELAVEEEAAPIEENIIYYEEEVEEEIPELSVCGVVFENEQQQGGCTVDVSMAGAEAVVAMHSVVYDDKFWIPENASAQKDGYEFIGYYCNETGETYAIGEYIPLSILEPTVDEEGNCSYRISLSAQYKEIKEVDPSIEYTDKNLYNVSVSIVNPADYSITAGTISGEAGSIDDSIGNIKAPRGLAFYTSKYQLEGYKSLITGNTFGINGNLVIEKLAAPVAGEPYYEKTSATAGNKIIPYEVSDSLVPVFNFYGAVGTYQDTTVDCKVMYYRAGDFISGEDLDAPVAYLNTEDITISIPEAEEGISLTAPEEVPGYIFVGYGMLDGTKPIYTEGLLPLNDCVEWGDGKLRFALKAFYEIDENYVPEEQPEIIPDEPEEQPEIIPDDPEEEPVVEYKNLGQEIKALNQTLKEDKNTLKSEKEQAKARKKASK